MVYFGWMAFLIFYAIRACSYSTDLRYRIITDMLRSSVPQFLGF
jgi:hypothetical protein